MSPKFGTVGNRCASTAAGNGSISLNATGVQPNGSHATLAASMPEQTLRYLTGCHPRNARRCVSSITFSFKVSSYVVLNSRSNASVPMMALTVAGFHG